MPSAEWNSFVYLYHCGVNGITPEPPTELPDPDKLLELADRQAATPAQLGLPTEDDVFLPTVLISGGRVLRRALKERGLSEIWLDRTLRERGCQSAGEVLLLSVDGAGKILCVKKEEDL